MANTADAPYRRWAKANFTTSFLYPLMVSRAVYCLLPLLWHLQSRVASSVEIWPKMYSRRTKESELT
jgi:hypothetical protein